MRHVNRFTNRRRHGGPTLRSGHIKTFKYLSSLYAEFAGMIAASLPWTIIVGSLVGVVNAAQMCYDQHMIIDDWSEACCAYRSSA